MMRTGIALNVFFRTKFESCGFVVNSVISRKDIIYIFTDINCVDFDIIESLKSVLGWKIKQISVDSGNLVFTYK